VKINVLQFIGSFHQGGSERQAVQVTRLLSSEKNLNVFAATLNKEGVLLKELEEAGFTGVPEFKLTSFFNLHFIKQIRACAKFLRENKIQIVHTHDFYTNVFGILAARYAGVPCKIASKRETSGLRTTGQKKIEKLIFKLADGITVNSRAVANFLLEQGIDKNKIKLTYNGLDLDRLKPKETDREKICRSLNLPLAEDTKFITLVANLRHPVKNQEMLLEAGQHLIEKYPYVHLVLAGEGERSEGLKAFAEKLGLGENTHFTGRCQTVPELLSISSVGVLTSTAEGFSNSILEYMAAGKPVVATDVGGAKEAIVEGETGFLVKINDAAGLARRLEELIKDPEKAKDMGERGSQIVEEKFSSRKQRETIVNLYNSFF
jgi:glycosyltransferase involved in cell wall biosynthesis